MIENHKDGCSLDEAQLNIDARQNLFLEFPTKRDSNQSSQVQGLARKNNIPLVASFDMMISKNRITKAIISLCACAGWYATLLFANPEVKCSRRSPYTVAV